MTEVHDGATLRAALLEIASDFSFTWIAEARLLFDALEPRRFAELHHNPTALLVGAHRRRPRAGADAGLSRAPRARAGPPRARPRRGDVVAVERSGPDDLLVAYFSAEFGLDESLPIYSGGLGVLAGDYLKAASELGVPLVGIGLFYRRGYFEQRLDEHDRQVEHYPLTDTSRLPLELVPMAPVVELADDDGNLVPVRLGVWRVRVGRVSLYLIDTQVERKPRLGRHRDALRRRPGEPAAAGARARRRRRARAAAARPRADGLPPERGALRVPPARADARARRGAGPLAGRGASSGCARRPSSRRTRRCRPGTRCSTPSSCRRASAGSSSAAASRGRTSSALGKAEPDEKGFGLTPFALRTSQYANAVSELHGAVAREMWHGLWPERRVDEVPITSVTNGVHQRTWISGELEGLLGDTDPQFERARELPAEDLWAAHRSAKERLLEFVATTRGARELDPDVLTIGFARRFATYKRASLLFSRPERLAQLLADPERPIQVLVAGKAHPADEGGKDLIQLVVDFAREPTAAGRIVFLEDYEMTLARRLVQGVDVWLNTPRRPFEASGTSGMKAALNGVLNCSILDGWWAEAYSPDCGFAIESPEAAERGGAGRGRRGGALRRARGAGAPGLLRARRGRPAAALDRADARVDRRARAALRHGADGGGVRRAALPAGARGRGAPRQPRRLGERRRADPEARLPLPAAQAAAAAARMRARRAQQHEQARPERPDRHAEDQAEPPDRADDEHDRDEAAESGPPARQDARPPGDDRHRGEREDRGELRSDEEEVDGVMERRGGCRGRCRSCRFRRRGRRPP